LKLSRTQHVQHALPGQLTCQWQPRWRDAAAARRRIRRGSFGASNGASALAAPKNALTSSNDFSRLPTPQCFYFPPLSSFLSLQVPLAAAAGT
jgi:hypothetical protein